MQGTGQQTMPCCGITYTSFTRFGDNIMCLIAYVPAGKTLPDVHIYRAATQNDDGIGVMSIDGIEKFLGNKMLKKAKRYIHKLQAKKAEFAVHFRYATHGAVSLDNCHPFELPGHSGYLMHNGVLSDFTAKATKERSDTSMFAETLTDDALWSADPLPYLETLAKDIGYGNKLCIMDYAGKFWLVNEPQGTWRDGVWYSQTYSITPRTVTTYAHSYGGATRQYAYDYKTAYGGDYYENHYYGAAKDSAPSVPVPPLPGSYLNPDTLARNKPRKFHQQYNQDTGKFDLVDDDGLTWYRRRKLAEIPTVSIPAVSLLPPIDNAPKQIPLEIVRAKEALERRDVAPFGGTNSGDYDPLEVAPGPWDNWKPEEKKILDAEYAALDTQANRDLMLPSWSELSTEKANV